MGRGSSGREGVNESYARANLETQRSTSEAIERLNDDRYEAGTYDLSTMQTVEYPRGYQVTFSQIGDNYSAAEFAQLCNEFLRYSSDGRISAGKYGGTPEVSFHVNDLRTARRLARKYNQISVWNWAASEEISTGGTGRRR